MILSKAIKDLSYQKFDKMVDEGDVVTFSQEVKGITINNTHRIVKDVYFDTELGAYCVVTRGDNPSAPTDAPIPITALKAKMIKKTTSLADIYDFLGSSSGIAIAIVLPMVLMLISTIYQLIIKIKKPAQKEEEALVKDTTSREEELKRQAVIEYLKEQAIKEYLEQKNDING
ncbi:MAG: hypothetical protein J6V83_04245, partial [Clostridia bacterium]|nr:hypothetical protein [Clostridia bacterium]